MVIMKSLLKAAIQCRQVIRKVFMKLLPIFIKELQNQSGEKNSHPGEFPTVHDGVRGMKFIHSVVESNKKGNVWVKYMN